MLTGYKQIYMRPELARQIVLKKMKSMLEILIYVFIFEHINFVNRCQLKSITRCKDSDGSAQFRRFV